MATNCPYDCQCQWCRQSIGYVDAASNGTWVATNCSTPPIGYVYYSAAAVRERRAHRRIVMREPQYPGRDEGPPAPQCRPVIPNRWTVQRLARPPPRGAADNFPPRGLLPWSMRRFALAGRMARP